MMAKVRSGLRGWGWLGWIVAAELVLLGAQAVPAFLPSPAALPSTRQASSTSAVPVRASLQPVLDFQPFGVAALPAAAPEPAPDAPATAPDTLILRGVLLRGDDATSRVLLSSDGGPARIYATGDALPGGGTLSGIEVDRIWIDLGGQTQILRFPEPGTTQPAPDQTSDEAGADASAPTEGLANAPAAQTKAQSVTQPDLRNLIPGLVADTLPKP